MPLCDIYTVNWEIFGVQIFYLKITNMKNFQPQTNIKQ